MIIYQATSYVLNLKSSIDQYQVASSRSANTVQLYTQQHTTWQLSTGEPHGVHLSELSKGSTHQECFAIGVDSLTHPCQDPKTWVLSTGKPHCSHFFICPKGNVQEKFEWVLMSTSECNVLLIHPRPLEIGLSSAELAPGHYVYMSDVPSIKVEPKEEWKGPLF